MKKMIDLKLKEKTFAKSSISILNDFTLTITSGEKIAIVGESGAGKSSLLNIIGLVDRHYSGQYRLFGMDAAKLNDDQRAKWRNERIGFILQNQALLNSFSLEDNIKLPLLYVSKETKKAKEVWFRQLVETLGIESLLKKKPFKCSGGERARAALARGLIMQPQLVLADEPTASLDDKNKDIMMELLFKLNQINNMTLITVTHDLAIAKRHDCVITIER